MQTASFIRNNGEFQAFPLCEILYIQVKKNYCEVHTISNKKYLTYVSLCCLEKQLPPNLFCRTHRSYIVAVHRIERFNSTQVQLGGIILPLSKSGYKELPKRAFVFANDVEKKLKRKSAHAIVKT